jgi:hypothetical protein
MDRTRTAPLRRAAARAAVVVALVVVSASTTSSVHAAAPSPLRDRVAKAIGNQDRLSAGFRMWLAGPPAAPHASRRAATPSFGTNVDANDPAQDLAAGQSETAIAAQRGAGTRALVLAGWNDISGALGNATTPLGSRTGVGLSNDGGAHFRDLVGLPNSDVHQQWAGDPAIASLGDRRHFAVASLYYPSAAACTDAVPAYGTVAVSIATVNPAGTGATFSRPVVLSRPGDLCTIGTPNQRPDVSLLDKEWIGYDPVSRTLAVSYTRFFFPPPVVCDPNGCAPPPGGASGLGQIELLRATVPADPATLSAAAFGAPAVVSPEEPNCAQGTPSSEPARCGAVNQGSSLAVARGGATYVAWERNIESNKFNGDPYVYLHAALVPAGAAAPSIGGPARRVVISAGQAGGNAYGGTKSLDTVPIAGYNRGTGQDFPRIALSPRAGKVLFEWNDTSAHPLGDIWLRSASLSLGSLDRTVRVNDDSKYALHFMPAVSVRADGTICSSWYDRRIGGASSTVTDYFAECRSAPGRNGTDFRVTTGSTDWAGTSSAITPNFGDYTDNATDGTRTYFTWSDGRIGVPQPFVARR